METFEKEFYRRNLPHWQPKEGVFNICFRLTGTLPKEKWLALRDERTLKIAELQGKYDFLSHTAFFNLLQKEEALYFGKFDELLDNLSTGPQFLKEREIAEIVMDCFKYWAEKGAYELICFCVMPNHVHLIITNISKPLFRVLQIIKTYTATQANRKLDRIGKAFWQKESYDNLIRDEEDMIFKINYILNNPVKARFVKDWKEWQFSYVNSKYTKYLIENFAD